MGINWKDTLRAVAPTIAAALGGPLAGAATKALGDKLLGNKDATEDELASIVVGADPETLLALKKAEEDFKVRMEELGIEREKLVYSDLASARAREAAVKDRMPMILALTSVLSFLVFVLVLLLAPEALTNENIVFLLIGYFGNWVGQVYTYFFGSSSGSYAKNKIFDKLVPQAKKEA